MRSYGRMQIAERGARSSALLNRAQPKENPGGLPSGFCFSAGIQGISYFPALTLALNVAPAENLGATEA